jgi:myo-inositol-1(or 4)-monophosphatase
MYTIQEIQAFHSGASADHVRRAKFMRELVREAGALALEMRHRVGESIESKGQGEWLSAVDTKVEEHILGRVAKEFPGEAHLAEETSAELSEHARSKGPLWVLDPIDGTHNFCRGVPHFGISLAWALDGVVQIGIVGAPAMHEEVFAMRDHGCYLNSQRVYVSAPPEWSRKLCCFGAAGPARGGETLDEMRRRVDGILKANGEIRRLGAASLDTAWVGCGRLDAFYEFGLKPWDVCAGVLAAREGGALFGSVAGERYTEVGVSDKFAGDICIAIPPYFEKFHGILNA